MDQTREERLQQRLRGAQRREITNVDFGFFFPPAPVAPVVEAQPNINTQPAPQPELSQPAARRSPRAQNRQSTSNLRAVTPGTHDANISVKRKKLESEVVGPPSSARSRSSQPPPRPDVYDLPEDNTRPEPAAEVSQLSLNHTPQIEVAEGAGTIATEVPTQEIHDDAPAAVELNVAAQAELPSVGVPDEPITTEIESTVDVSRKKRKRGEPVAKPVSPPEEPRRRSTRGVQPSSVANEVDDPSPKPKQRTTKATRKQATAAAIDEVDELSPEPKSKRQKAAAKEILPAASEVNELPSQPKRGRPKSAKQAVPDVDETQAHNEPAEEEEDVPEEAVAIDDAEAAVILKKNRGRRISRRVPQVELAEEDPEPEAPVPKKQRGRPRAPLSPAQQRHPKPKQTKPSKAKTSGAGNKEAIRLGSPIPVTVHRLTKRSEYDGDESDAEILNSEIPHAKRGGVNAVDVLSQFCQEIIDDALETLNNGAANTEDSTLRREYKTKGRAIEEFGLEIQARLLDHTISIENGRALEKRVRDEQRRKLALREEILRIRAEREQVALRMDEIRIKHEEERKTTDERTTLNNAVHDIEVAIDRGKAKEEPSDDVEKTGIELLLKRVAGEVSSNSDGGGLLKQIKEFNAFLERTALVLKV